jgi:putative glutamine amidotransferase
MSARKPLIGINGEFRAARKDVNPLSWFNTGYYDSVTAAGGLPMLIPPLADDNDLRQYLEMLDGLVLCGCLLDLDPVRLGMEKHPSTRPMPARREDFDRRLCRMAVEMRMPLLAIGVGMQTLNVVCGGTLFQHVAEDVLKALCHRDPVENCLRHVIEMRTAPGAEEELRSVFDKVAEIMCQEAPSLFQDFTRGDDGTWTPEYRKV